MIPAMSEALRLAITLVLFFAAVVVGAVVHARSARFSTRLPEPLRAMLRLAYAASVALAVWTNSAYALWLAGVPLAIGAIRLGLMPLIWWFPPLTLVWAVLCYWALRTYSRKPQR